MTGSTVVAISGGSGFTDSTTVTICNITVVGMASRGGARLTFATPAAPRWCPPGPAALTTSNPTTDGLPAFTYVSTVVPGSEGLTGTVRAADGTPRSGVAIWILRTFEEGILATTTTDVDGTYLLPVPADHYTEAVAFGQDPPPPTAGLPYVYHEVQYFELDIQQGGTTLVDWVLPGLSMKANCAKSTCKAHESVRGFNALEPVAFYLQSVDVPGFPPTLLGTVTTDESGAANETFEFARPTVAGAYYTTAGPGHPVSYLKTVVSTQILQVP